jgi:nucleoside-diphosphate-sugar epimerase
MSISLRFLEPCIHIAIYELGGTGFVGSAILQNLLSKGFFVRAAVRSDSRAALVKSTFRSYVDSGKLTFVIVTDILNETAFDDAVKDVDAIVHCASPSPPANPEAHPDEILDPAIKGTIGVMESAAKYGLKVKRVVVTSSVVTLFQPQPGPYVYSEVRKFHDIGNRPAEMTIHS